MFPRFAARWRDLLNAVSLSTGMFGIAMSLGSAAPADLDATFGSGGKVTVSPGESSAGLHVMADGRLVTGGSVSGDFWVARFLEDGAADTSFGVNGVRTIDFGGYTDYLEAIAPHPDGGFVVAGQLYYSASNSDFVVARLDANGNLDTSFSGDGKATVNFGAVEKCYDVVVQPDGKVVMVGTTSISGTQEMALARLNANGSLDTSFGGTGKITLSPGTVTGSALNAVGLLSDGRIVAAGYAGFGSVFVPDSRFVVLCYTESGALDTSFSDDGIMNVDIRGSSDDYAESLVIQSDDKIVLGGLCYYTGTSPANRDMALARVNPDGSMDTSFSGDGKLYTTWDFSSQDYPYDIAVDAAGKVLIVGSKGFDQPLVFRFHANGQADSSFGTGGKAIISLGFGGSFRGVGVQSSGRIVLAGNGGGGAFLAGLGGDPPPPPPTITNQPVPLDVDALQDAFFSVTVEDPTGVTYQWLKNGVEIPGATSSTLLLESVTTDDGGGYSVECINGNGTTTSNEVSLTVFRLPQTVAFPPIADRHEWTPPFNPGATLSSGLEAQYASDDSTVATASGSQVVPVGPGSATITASHPGDNVYLPAAGVGQSLMVLASGPDGTLDAGFGTAGVGSLPLIYEGAVATVVKHLPDGRFLVAGHVQTGHPTYYDAVIARYHADGSLDTTFGTTGVMVHPVGELDDIIYDMAIQDDGKIVLVGICKSGGSNVLSAIRLMDNGPLDTSFGTGGWAKLTTTIGVGDAAGLGVALEPDGDVLVCGYVPYAGVTNGRKLAVVRFTSGGVLDTSFGTSGVVELAPGTLQNDARSIAVQPDGRIVFCGDARDDGAYFDLLLARLESNGSLDTTFGTAGMVVMPISSDSDIGWEMRLMDDGRIVVAGQGGIPMKGLVARFLPDGTLDPDFATGGKILVPAAPNVCRYLGLEVSPNGAIYACGWADLFNSNVRMLVTKLRPDGTLDTAFGNNGSLLQQVYQIQDYSWGCSLGPDSSLVVVGFSHGDAPPDFPMFKLDGNGGPLTYDAWASEQGVVGGPEDPGPLGMPHIVAYALGVDPASPEPPPFPISDGRVTFTMSADAAAMGGLVYGIEVSDNLIDWTAVLPDISDSGMISWPVPEGTASIYARLLVAPE